MRSSNRPGEAGEIWVKEGRWSCARVFVATQSLRGRESPVMVFEGYDISGS